MQLPSIIISKQVK